MEWTKDEGMNREKQIQCFSCNTYFSSLEELCRHIALRCRTTRDKQTKSALKPFQCRKCFQIFARCDLYEKHWSVQHEGISKLFMYENPHPCEQCGLVFCNSRALRRHLIWRKCIPKSTGFCSLLLKPNDSETINYGQINVDIPHNKEEISLINLNASNVKACGNNFTNIERNERQNNFFVPLYFSDYFDSCQRQKDTHINKKGDIDKFPAENTTMFAKCDDFPVPEIAKTFSITEKNLFESLGNDVPDQSSVAPEIFNDKAVDSFHGSISNFETKLPVLSESTKSILTNGYFEELLQKYVSTFASRKKQQRTEKATKNCKLLTTPKYHVECRVCHLSVSSSSKYRKHFSAVHSDYSLDDMYDDGWKCSLCSSVHRNIDELRMHWIKKHKEYYNKEQFREFKKQNFTADAAACGSASVQLS